MQTEKHERLAAENARIAKKQHREELRKIAALAQAQAKAEQAKAKAEAEAPKTTAKRNVRVGSVHQLLAKHAPI